MKRTLSIGLALGLVGLSVHLATAMPLRGPARRVVGDHHSIGLRHPLGGGLSASSALATFTAAGALDFANVFDNDDGAVSGPGIDTGSTWMVTPGHVLDVITASGDDALGGVSRRGDVIAGAVTSNGADPSMVIFTKKGGIHSDASLNGDYFLSVLLKDLFGGTLNGGTGTATFDGAGSYTINTIDNEDGVISGPSADAGTYAVAPDGSLTIYNGMGDALLGGINERRDFALAAGFNAPGASPTAALLLKKSGRYTNRSFRGRYFLTLFEWDLSGPGYRTATGRLVADGAGSLTITTFDNEGGVAIGPTAGVGTYTVAPDGTLTVFTGGGETLRGGLGRRGQLGIFGGGISPGSDPNLGILIKR